MQYLDFDLHVSGSAGGYEVSARSVEGEVRESIQLSLADEDRAAAGQLFGAGATGAARRVGRKLFDMLFAGAVRGRYGASRTAARRDGTRLRVRLSIAPSELAALPWELLFDPDEGEHLCLTRDIPFVRTLPAAQPVEALTTATPLRLLAMIASPDGAPQIDVQRERQRLEEAVAPLVHTSRVALTWVDGQTWRALQEALQGGRWHMFHFLGHGGYDEQAEEGFIVLADEQGDALPLTESQFGRMVANHDPLRLAVLMACGSEQGGAHEPFAGIAATLIRRGLPAALAMQRPLSAEAARELTRSFYGALAKGVPVDEAVVEARVAMSMVPNSGEWATPVLYSRAPDGVLFELPTQPAAGAAETPQQVAAPDPRAPRERLRALAAQSATSVERPALRKAMADALSMNDITLLCADLSARIGQRLDVEDLGGTTKEMVILNLIQHLERRGLLQALLDALRS